MEIKDLGFFEVKKELSENDFQRKVLVNLGLNKEVPSDIFDAEFEDVVLENKHFVGFGGSAEVKCSASIGHDYYVDETHYNEFSKNVVKERVRKTNWSPYQTTYFAEDAWGFAENSENPSRNEFPVCAMAKGNFVSLNDLSQEELEEKGVKEVDNTVLKRARQDMISNAEYQCKETLPGDRYAHATFETKESITCYINVILARYSMNYKYAGQVYSMEQYVKGQWGPYGEPPKQTVEEKADKKVKILGIASCVISMLLIILSVRFHINAIVSWFIFALSTGVFAAYEWHEIRDRKKRSRGKWISKRKALVEMLAKKGLDPLNEQEEKQFSDIIKTAHSVGFSRRGVLVRRAESGEDNYIQQGLECIETLALQLDRRFPDTLGAAKKAEYQSEVLRVIRSFGDNGDVPDGWKLFYAYKQLVLAACLFGKKDYDAGWREFDSAVEK